VHVIDEIWDADPGANQRVGGPSRLNCPIVKVGK